MIREQIVTHITSMYPGSCSIQNNEGIFLYSKKGQTFPFATMVDKDNDYDYLSHLDREGYFRLNIGVSKRMIGEIFGDIDPMSDEWKKKDFTKEDVLIPHPMYASLGWISIINPSQASLDGLKPYIDRAYNAALSQDAWLRK